MNASHRALRLRRSLLWAACLGAAALGANLACSSASSPSPLQGDPSKGADIADAAAGALADAGEGEGGRDDLDATSSVETGSGGDGGGATPDAGPSGGSASKAALLAKRLGRAPNFLIGFGNDGSPDYDHNKDGAYTLGVTLDLHYDYLTGIGSQAGGWPNWNAGGTFIDVVSAPAKARGVTPMYTLYAMAAEGQNNFTVLTDDGFMKSYLDGAVLLFQRIHVVGVPAVVQIEPDFWGFAERHGAAAMTPVHLHALEPECSGVVDDLTGFTPCLLLLARKYAPEAVVGLHVSSWGGDDAAAVAAFMKQVHADEADLLFTDVLDRDVGCYEAHTDPNCPYGGQTYWADTDFATHLGWVKEVTGSLGLPLMWWQLPLGAPSATPGGTPGHYRDDRVSYFFSHVGQLVAAGGVGAAFGVGAGNQTYITTDGDQFKSAVTAYYAAPYPLP